MSADYWLKQHVDSPVFPDILWSRPQTKRGAGKLGIIGGNALAFGAPGSAYNYAASAGAGVIRVLLPEAIKKNVAVFMPEADYAPSNRSGSFSKTAVAEFSEMAQWSDGVILAGDFGRNSETAVVLETFVAKYKGLLTVTQDAVDYFKETPLQLVDRVDTLIVLSLAQLQKMFIATPNITAITFGMSTQQLVDALHNYTNEHAAGVITMHNGMLFFAHGGRVVTQKDDRKTWRVEVAAKACVFWMQNPSKLLEAAASSVANTTQEDA